jgi:urease accessory protein
MAWHAQLALEYALQADRTVVRHQHTGPLRVLQNLYPEGNSVCHNVLIHPPSGLVGGDTLNLQVQAQAGAHGLITTPGATRFYRSDGPLAVQSTHLRLAPGARLEWLPLESIAYSGCRAENKLVVELEPGAELIGWDITALGLPLAQLPFLQGHFSQHISLTNAWTERACLRADDHLLLHSPAGLAGQTCMGTLFFMAGETISRVRKESALDAVRHTLSLHSLAGLAGATCPHSRVLVVRVLAPVVEPALDLLRLVWQQLRSEIWGISADSPRIWSM